MPDPNFQAFGMNAVVALLALGIALALQHFVTDRTAVVLAHLRKVVLLSLGLLLYVLPKKLVGWLRLPLARVLVLHKSFQLAVEVGGYLSVEGYPATESDSASPPGTS